MGIRIASCLVGFFFLIPAASCAAEKEVRIPLDAAMIRSSSERADFSGLVDEQPAVGDPPSGQPEHGWKVPSQFWRDFPYAVTVDLGRPRNLSNLWLYDTNGAGDLVISAGRPDHWEKVTEHETGLYRRWTQLPLDVTTQYLRIELKSAGANFGEIALYEYTLQAHEAMLARKDAEARERAERDVAIANARTGLAQQPWVELPPFGRVRLVDEVDCSTTDPGHHFREDPSGVSTVETILGRPCRVLRPTENESSYMAFRLGKWRLLKPGALYVLAIDYPEDEPRSVIVMNSGNETSRGFHTGTTVGDALHPKYVNNNPESLHVPLSGRYETWTLCFHLHDRFPDLRFLRGKGDRPLTADDGFDVAVAQFSARNDPTSRGVAVSSIRLYEVADDKALAMPLHLPPSPLPRRRIFWREEMADGVIQSDKETERGVKNRLDWYRFKVTQMRLLGINTFSKDLLEFGACQHWDSTPYGGNEWVYFDRFTKDLWPQIVALMGSCGFDVLPYYEYSGSKGSRGLGGQRRCKPLTRDDAYTHISWVESANADITDPETYDDFKKMLDLTVIRLKDRAEFAGIWLRPRWQLPMSFSDTTRDRFAHDANGDRSVSRADLIGDSELLARYEQWWYEKRRDFLVAMQAHLRQHGIDDPVVLFTAECGEPGTSFPTWEKRLVTDDVDTWKQILAQPKHIIDNKPVVPFPVQRVIQDRLYLEALLAAPMNWGRWEVHHANPPADPQRYAKTPGVLMTHCINRSYTAALPDTFDAFRTSSQLAVVRHHSLNENMMFDRKDQPKLGYFVADVERAGPHCMMAEALAVANGAPTMIGYLMGNNFGRGFPHYVRQFNAAFLALPALPSRVLPDASPDPDVVVRQIDTKQNGTYFAVVNTAKTEKRRARLHLPVQSVLQDAAAGAPLPLQEGAVQLDFHAFQLRALHAP